MAALNSWFSHIEAFVDTSRSSSEHDGSLEAIAQLVNKGLIGLLDLVREMEMYLTTNDNIIRSRGILLLGETLSKITQKPLDSTCIESLADFFISRLEDWSSVKGALIGCLAILRRKNIIGTISENDVKRLIDKFFELILVPSLGPNDRKLCYEIIICLCTDHSDTVISRGEDLLHEILQSVDEEKDPECLIYSFKSVRISMQLFAVLSDSACEDTFDIMSKYFPVYFTHGGGEGTREELSETLLDIFCSSPNFAQYVIPFLLEKLSTSFPLAKLDSLKYLQKCIVYYGPEKLADYIEPIWSTLKNVIFYKQEDQIAKESLKCFQTLVSVLISPNKDSLFNLISEKLDLILSENNFSNFYLEIEDELNVIGKIFAIMSGVSDYLCTRVFEKYFVNLVGSINSFNFGALYLVYEIIKGCKGLTMVSEELTRVNFEKESWWNILKKCSHNLSTNFVSLVNNNITSLEKDNNLVIAQQYILYAVKVLQELSTFPPSFSVISEEIYISILEMLISIINTKFENQFLYKLSLESLVQIGSSIDKFHDSNKASVYNNMVLEKIISIFQTSNVPILMKLDLIFGIGTVGTSCMKRVVRVLEDEIILNINKVCLEGELELKSAEIVVNLLDFYSNRIFTWLCNSGDASEIAVQFATRILNQMENITILNNIHIKGILESIMQTIKHLVTSCIKEHQSLILEKSFDLVLKMISFPVESISNFEKLEEFELGFSNSISVQDSNLISLFSSVVISLHPQTPLPTNSNSNLISNLFLFFLLKGHTPSAQAFASILNKSSPICNPNLDKSLKTCLSILSKNKNILKNEIITNFAWIAKGLIMKGDERSKEIIKFLLKHVLSSENELEISICAAEGFHVIMSDSQGVLCKNLHAVIKPLYKQRLFSSLIPVFLDSMKEADRSSGRAALSRAFGHVVSDAPLAAVIGDAYKIVPAIADSVTTLGTNIQNKDVIYSLLLVLSGILMDSNGKEAIVENLHIVVRLLTQLVSYPHMMLVRETAIQCLTAMSNLPHSRIYPMRTQVLRAAINALNDKRQVVRREAVRCRHAWSRSF